MKKTVEIVVRGKVQGVWFRKNTQQKAEEFGLVGYVMNQPDGSVFIKATGSPEALNKLEDWCHIGPEAAVVDSVQRKEVALESFHQFSIKH